MPKVTEICGLKVWFDSYFAFAPTLGIVLLILWVHLYGTIPVWADLRTEDKQLKDLIQGFEEDKSSTDQPLEEVLEGFEDEEDISEAPDAVQKPRAPIALDGYAKLGLTYNYAHRKPDDEGFDYRGLSRLRGEVRFDLLVKPVESWRLLVGGKYDYDGVYAIRGRSEFSDEVLDAYESEFEWHETYAQGRLGRYMDIKVGRQIVVWGRSDYIRITDVLNPLDLREPGLTDIEDLRLPATMTRLDGYGGPWHLSGIALHEVRFNKDPVYGNDFFPGSAPLPHAVEPTWWGADTEWALALNGIFSGKDISLYWAEFYDENTYIRFDSEGDPEQRHARINMHGVAAGLALGNWLLKYEAAYFTGLRFANNSGGSHSRFDTLFGIEYSGWDDTNFSYEWAVRHLLDYHRGLASAPDYAQEDEIINAIQFSKDFSNQTVNLTLLAMVYGPLGQDGALERLTVSYDWSDAWTLTAGLVMYQSGDTFLRGQIDENDRMYAEVKYSY